MPSFSCKKSIPSKVVGAWKGFEEICDGIEALGLGESDHVRCTTHFSWEFSKWTVIRTSVWYNRDYNYTQIDGWAPFVKGGEARDKIWSNPLNGST